MKTENEIINSIFSAKDRYYSIKEKIDPEYLTEEEKSNNSYSGQNFLLDLMEIRKELSCLSLDLAKITGEHLREYKIASSIVYTKRYLKQKELMASGEKVTAAESKSKQHVTQEVKNEYEHEADYMSCKLILTQTNELLASVKQDISIIRKDYESIGDRE